MPRTSVLGTSLVDAVFVDNAVAGKDEFSELIDTPLGYTTAKSIIRTNTIPNALVEGEVISTDGTFSSNSDALIPTEKAIKTYVTGAASHTSTTSPQTTLFYDATRYSTLTVGLGGGLDIQTTGTITIDHRIELPTITWTNTRFDDIRVAINALKIGPSGAPTFSSSPPWVYLFDHTAINSVYFNIQLPHSYKEESALTPHIHFIPTTNNTGTIRMHLDYEWQDIDSSFSAVTTIYKIFTIDANSMNKHILMNFPVINGTGKHISSMLSCKLYRQATDVSDTYPDDIGLLEFDVHYKMDTLGSASITSK